METLKDLLEEAKRRTILVAILVLIVAYVMSLTSSSVWINLPVSVIVLAALRRLSFEVDIRWKPRIREGRPQYPQHQHRRQLTNYDPLLSGPSHMAANRWRHSLDSPVVEAAVDELTRCVVDEWVTNLWYSSLSPDQEAPEELRILINGVIAQVAQRAKRVNLITLLSRDVVDLVGTHFELYRRMKAKIGPDIIGSLSMEERDEKLKHAMMTSRELHPALLSPEAEYKVLKKLTGGVVALVLKRQDAHCRLLRTLARELLACAVLRPVLNFASPGYINELIETLVVASNERERQASGKTVDASDQPIPERIPENKLFSSGLDTSGLGSLESRGGSSDINLFHKITVKVSTRTEDAGESTINQLPVDTKSMKEVKATELSVVDKKGLLGPTPHADWAQVLDTVTQRRAQALTPEHLDNLWAKGRNYKKRETEKAAKVVGTAQDTDQAIKTAAALRELEVSTKVASSREGSTNTEHVKVAVASPAPIEATVLDALSPQNQCESISDQYGALLFGDPKAGEEHLPGIGFSPVGTPRHTLESVEGSTNSHHATDVGGPELVRSRSNDDLLGSSTNSQSMAGISGQSPDRPKFHHKSGSGSQRLRRAVRLLAHRKTRSSGGALDGWQDLEGQSLQGLTSMLNVGEIASPKSTALETQGRWRSARKSQMLDATQPSVQAAAEVISHTSPTMLHCRVSPKVDASVTCLFVTRSLSRTSLERKPNEVLGAHFEKIGSKSFAVYTIRVKDTENRTWRVQRRFRNFEQLHRHLKDMPYYNLSLPPKRFLASSLDNSFVRERCVLLDKYLKDLLAIPSVAELHEVWDFLSVNSQHYTHGNSLSMMKTLAVSVDDAVDDMFRQIRGVSDDISGALKTATSGIRQRLPMGGGDLSYTVPLFSAEDATSAAPESLSLRLTGPSQAPYLTDSEFSERPTGKSHSEDEYGGAYGGSVPGPGSVGWQSDSDLQLDSSDTDPSKSGRHAFASGLDVVQGRIINSRLEGAFSDGHSPVESFASDTVEDDLAIPQEWSPPKVSVPLLNLVDLVFQLQGRGWIRRQVLWMAKQILQLGMGDAIDDWLLGRIQWLRNEEVVASGIRWVKRMLWPDGTFVTKHPRNFVTVKSSVLQNSGIEVAEEDQQWQPRPPINSFEYRLEAARRAGVVREVILERAPTTLVSLIGKKQYARCAKDIYYFSQQALDVRYQERPTFRLASHLNHRDPMDRNLQKVSTRKVNCLYEAAYLQPPGDAPGCHLPRTPGLNS